MNNRNNKIKYRVRVSVYPTSHNKIWLSSGHIPLYNIPDMSGLKYLSVLMEVIEEWKFLC